MNTVHIYTPPKLVVGDHSFKEFIQDIQESNFRKLFVLADPNVIEPLDLLKKHCDDSGIIIVINSQINSEPTINDLEDILNFLENEQIDAVIGIGGGSVLDVAKLVAVLHNSEENVHNILGIGKITHRSIPLFCLPTTAGTGSEVSPNAILLDSTQNLKVGVISKYLVPDSSYIDPTLTYTVPYHVSASTGIDALTHCLEAYANNYAHSIIDMYALEGIKLIYNNLELACNNNPEARAKVALGSLYGGMCLGPVNTAAVHALAYPLGSEFKIAHGVSNALLLPHVIEANLPFGVDRYEKIALCIGAKNSGDQLKTAKEGIRLIKNLCATVGIPLNLSSMGINQDKVPAMAKSAMKVDRLLKNNPRNLTKREIENIYNKLF